MVEPIEQGFRSSPQQRRVWRLQEDGRTACTSLCALRIEGDLDPAALRRALAETVVRHEILRTAFRLPAGLNAPLQIILEPGPVSLPETDLRDLSPEHRSAGAADLLSALGRLPFDLARGEGWRAALVRHSAGEHELLLAFSAACADPGTFEPLAADLLAAYAGQVSGRSEEPEPPLQYADVAEWQNSLLEGEDTAEAVEAWREHWREHGIDAQLAQPLPLEEREAAPHPSFTPQVAAVPLDRETAGALARLAGTWGCPLAALLLTAWKAVIQRGTGRGESLAGVLYAGRDAEELRDVVGPLARYLPVAVRFDPAAPFREALDRVREAVTAAERRGEYFSWDHVVGEGRGDGFPVCFEAAVEDWERTAAGLRVTPARLVWNSALLDRFALALSCCGDRGDGEDLRLALRYDPRLFREEAVLRLAGRLAALLGSAAARPEISLADHPAMSEDELGRWRELCATPPAADRGREGKTLHAVFEEQADRAPDRLAVVAGDGRLTFRELDERANRLAHHLRAAGAGPEVSVALCLDRSAEALVALLAVWKAGAAYVPLDPTQPAERLAWILADTGAPLLVTESRLAASLPDAGDLPGLRTLRLDEEAAAIADRPAERPVGVAGPRNLAYTIYTSGSTGRPKGVQIEHRSPLLLLAALEAAVLDPLAAESGRPGPLLASLNAPMIFDASVQQLALLLAGHALCIVPQEVRADGAALLAFLHGQGVELLDCTPSQLRLLVDAGLLDGPQAPRIVLTAGEAVDEPLWRRLAEAERTVSFNLYGPTECSVDATVHRIEAGSTRPTIGRPLAGYAVFLLDHSLQPAPPGAPGELFLGGTGLARGYVGRPDLTAERFVPHPFAERPGERLYRTGDLGRHRPDGNLEFLGRLDHQVKIRGYRIELGEIEAVLASHPWVREAVVLARTDVGTNAGIDTAGQPVLVAYVRLASESGADRDHAHGELHGFLRGQLPAYMVPAAFVVLEAFPTTPSGKVDRRALSLPSLGRPGLTSEYAAPATPLEQLLAGVWEEVLGVKTVGVHDDFFELGGHSLLATQAISRIRAALRLEISVRRLFEAPTVAGLAAAVEAAREDGATAAPPIVRVPRGEPLPLSFAQERLWFLDQLSPESPAYNLPLALELRGDLDVATLESSLREIARRHENLRTTFTKAGGEPRQEVAPEPRLALPEVDLRGLPPRTADEEALRLTREETLRPFDLARGPLVRAALLRRGDRHWTALFTMHHIVSDAWSLGVLTRELSALYPAFLRGLPPQLPELPIQYADFAVWQRGWLQGDVLEAQLAWWRGELAGAPDLLELPTDRPRPPVQSGRGATVPLRLPAAVARDLAALARQQEATPFMVLLAAYQALLARYARQDDVLVGSPVANRNRTEVEGLIGFFVNTLVLRGRLGGAPTFRELVARTRASALGAYASQDLPFEKLVDEMRVPRNLSHNPLVQVMLQLQNAPAASLELPGLSLAAADDGGAAAKLDLALSLGGGEDHLEGSLTYITDLFDHATAVRLLEHFGALLAGALADPDLAVGELPLLGDAERDQLRAWGQGGAAAATSLALELFAAQVARDAGADALLWGGERISYGELARSVERRARHLRALGVGPETVAALFLERTPRLIEGMLAVWAAGGAFLPLDPDYPAERLRFLLADSGAGFVLTTSGLADRLAGISSGAVRTVLLDDEPPMEPSTALPAPEAGRSAYVIYTSGSTGTPKGVVVEHRGIPNLATAQARMFDVRPGDRVLQFASPSFDASVSEVWMALSVGAALVLASREEMLPGPDLLGLLLRREITHVTLPPTALAALPAGAAARLVALRGLIVAGEPCPLPLARAWAAGRRFFNGYGPTESTVCATAHELAGDERERLPIGRPLPGFRAHVLDRALLELPAGVPGELLVGGIGLARGYLGRPELTAERFVPDPFAAEPGGRLYRTGDLARWLPDGGLDGCLDGCLDYWGRVDQQVKVRGFRIELGEIEAALQALPGVREAAVLSRGEGADRKLVAYVVPEDLSAAELRTLLRTRLPEPMVPSAWVALPALPLSPNGKIDRRALGRIEPGASGSRREERGPALPRNRAESAVAAVWCEVLGLDQVDSHESFFDLGGHSLLLVRVQERLARDLGREVSLVDLFRHPTVSALAAFLEPEAAAPAASRAARRGRGPVSSEDRRIAVIGMAGRFPGSADIEAFWQNLCDGVELISFHSEEELAAAGVDPALRSSPQYVPASGVLEGIELFDADFFGYTPRDAEIADPQHRLFLECAWEALESAGYAPEGCPGPVGVFAGVSRSSYLLNLISNPEILQAMGTYKIGMATDKDFLTTNVSYKLDLRGPSFSVQTACSTSLVAIHVACRSLLAGECDMALAGGVSITVPQHTGYLYQEGGINSPDGHCRAFDARAEGTLGGNGAGLVVLKRLDDALADGDPIHAVVLGSAINNDGAGKVGYTAPGVDGQAEVIRAALEAGGVDPRTIGYVEAHGTATPLGDPIEVAALTQAFRETGTEERGFCALGSVKTNIGHLDAAAGVAGFIKAALAVERGLVPPSLHFESPNPAIDFAASPFRVNDRLREWDGGVRRAGVSAFGIGGTNVHAVLEEPPAAEPGSPPRHPWQLLVLSARTPSALDAAASRLRGFLEARSETDLADVADLADLAWTLQTGRRAFAHRRAVLCRDTAEALAALAEPGGGRAEEKRGAVFLFPGQGAQHPGMGLGLYRSEPVFRAEIDRAAEILLPGLGLDLRDLLASEERDWEDTALAQPALFAVEHALARLWMSWGLRPEAMIGHSLGEYVAACLAGVFSFEDGLALVAERGRLLGSLPRGSMASLPLPEAEVVSLLAGDLALAAVNGPAHCVVSGPDAEVQGLLEQLAARGIEGRRLRTSHAFHSAMMEPAVAPFAAAAGRIKLAPPRLPWISNVTGTWISAAEATDPGYWAQHLRAPVRFADGLATLLQPAQDRPAPVLLEVGPGRTLSALARRHPDRAAAHSVVTSLRHPEDAKDDVETVLAALGQLWSAGAPVDWRAFSDGERRRRLALPTYPFERRRYWIEPGKGFSGVSPTISAAPERREMADWFSTPFWKPAPAIPAGDACGLWLAVLRDAEDLGDDGFGEALLDQLRGLGAELIVVRPGGRLRSREDWNALLGEIAKEHGSLPPRILHLGSAGPVEPADGLAERLARLEREKDRGFYSLLSLIQALGDRGGAEKFEITVVTSGAQRVAAGDLPCPERALTVALCRVAPREHAGLACRAIDVGFPVRDRWLGRIAAEIAAPVSVPLVAWRGGERWLPELAPLRIEERRAPREEEVWLVTGGLGGIGLEIAEHLAASRARLVLLGRTGLPPEEEWDRRLAEEDGIAERIARIRRMRALGAEVVVEAADVADTADGGALCAVARRAVERFGRLDGVIHAAGVPGGGLIELRTRESLDEEIAVKVQGTLAVGEICREHSPDHLVLFSSISAFDGQLGQTGYCAANAFLDSWAHLHAAETGTPTLTINWGRWQGTGMAAAAERRHRELTGDEMAGGMSPAEGVEAFARALASGLVQVVVSPVDVAAQLARQQGLAAGLREAAERRPATASVHERPALATPYVPPSDDLEQEIAEIWQEVLGIQRIGIHDDFFELGGDSLVALQLVSRLSQAVGVELRVRSLFDAPTIAALALFVEEALLASASQEEMDLALARGREAAP